MKCEQKLTETFRLYEFELYNQLTEVYIPEINHLLFEEMMSVITDPSTVNLEIIVKYYNGKII